MRKTENRVRIAAQLIDARPGVHLWADRYDGFLNDILRRAGRDCDERHRRN
jgi:adenylate cyclase